MADKSAGPLDNKKVVFATSNDISELKQYGGSDRVVAVMPGTTKEQIAELKAAGYSDVVLWDPNPSQSTVDEVKNMGYDAVIVQNEGPQQGEGSKYVADNLAGSGVTTGMVTNNWMPTYDGYGNVSVVMPEVYGTDQTWDGSTGNTETRFPPGYNPTIMPVVGGDQPPPGYESYAGQQAAGAATHGGYGVFSGNHSPEVMNPLLSPTVNTASTPSGTESNPNPSGTGTNPTPKPKPKPNKPEPTPSSDPSRPPDAGDSGLGSTGQSEPTHPKPPPAPYQGGAPVEKVIHTADGGTITITATGAVIKQGPNGTAYREGWVDPNSISSIDSADDLKGQIVGGASNPYTTSHPPAETDASSTGGYGTNDIPVTAQPVPKGLAIDPAIQAAIMHSQTPTTSPYISAAPSLSSSSAESMDPAIASAVKKKSQPSSDSGGGATTGGGGGGSSQEIYNPPQIVPDSVPVEGGGSCFAAGTPVLTPDGEKSIEEVKEGDKVQSWDFSTSQLVTTEVTKTLVHQNKATIVLTTGLGDLVTTPEHRFWTGSGWTSAGKLEANSSRILDKDGDLRLVKSVKDGQSEDVYHFHVGDPHHNYFAGHLLGHNMKQL